MATSLFASLMLNKPVSIVGSDTPDMAIKAISTCLREQGVTPYVADAGLLETTDFAPMHAFFKDKGRVSVHPRTPTRHVPGQGLIVRHFERIDDAIVPAIVLDLRMRRVGWQAAKAMGGTPADITAWHTVLIVPDRDTAPFMDLIHRHPDLAQALMSVR